MEPSLSGADRLGAVRFEQLRQRRFLPFTDTDSYRVLKVATEAFVMVNCNVLSSNDLAFNQEADLGYLDRRDLPLIANLPDQLQQYFVTIGGARLLPSGADHPQASRHPDPDPGHRARRCRTLRRLHPE